ncbi:hypothetical protein BN14_05280 [Rhizoctonia solani AG-1 IB]|nr:hypothetical protein BN14_05280 [Rhizoctonia solani AG-1 IB]
MSLDHLIVKPANEAQSQEAIHRDAAYWGDRVGITVDEYLKTFAVFEQGAFARDGKLKIWVLAPEDDPETTNFYASCQILTREVLTLQSGQKSPRSSYGHGITSVLVPPKYRGNGYAKRFMSLMHSALAPHRYPNSLKVPQAVENPSTVSILYSIIGDYYARCTPAAGQSGWNIQKSFDTTWSPSSALGSRENLPPIEFLRETDIAAVLDSDDSNIGSDLVKLQKQDPTKTYFAFVPAAPLNEFSVILGKIVMEARGATELSWGARIPGTNNFMTWVFYGIENIQLIVTRLRATAESFPLLLGAALQTARDTKCENVEIWNVPDELKTIAAETGGETTERMDELAGFKWYGQESNSQIDNTEVVWALEER